MNFSNIKSLTIPEGSVTALRINGVLNGIQLWSSVPSNRLRSSDKFILKDVNNLYLIPKENSRLKSLDNFILKDANNLYLVPKEINGLKSFDNLTLKDANNLYLISKEEDK
jgi:hypothetical protein